MSSVDDNDFDDEPMTDDEQEQYEELMQQLLDIENQIDVLNLHVAVEDFSGAMDANSILVGLVQEFHERYEILFGHPPVEKIEWEF